MIISHKHKFIFVKTRKTAGTSIEVTLSKYCGPNDVVTEINPPEAGHEPRNFWIDQDRGVKFYNHMPATEIRALVGDETWNSYYKFCVERHPYLKTISLFHMHRHHAAGNKAQYTFERWLRPENVPSDFFMYADANDKLMVDRVIRFKDLKGGFAQVCEHLGLPCREIEARAKADYEKVPVELTKAQRAFLQQQYAKEFAQFGFAR